MGQIKFVAGVCPSGIPVVLGYTLEGNELNVFGSCFYQMSEIGRIRILSEIMEHEKPEGEVLAGFAEWDEALVR